MVSQERQPNPLNREGMDENTPHGKAQRILDELVECSRIACGAPFGYFAAGEPKPKELEIAIIPAQGEKMSRHDKPDNNKAPSKTHDIKGFTGFYKGTFYRNGVPPQRSKK